MSDVRLEPSASNASVSSDRRGETPVNYAVHLDEAVFADDKWPAWKVTVFVVAVCGAFWTGLAYLLVRLLA